MAAATRKSAATELASLLEGTASFSAQIDAYSSRFTAFEETGNQIKGSFADAGSRPAAIASLHAYLLRDLPNRDLKHFLLQSAVLSEHQKLKQNIRHFFTQMHAGDANQAVDPSFIEQNLSALQRQADRIVHIWETDPDDCCIL